MVIFSSENTALSCSECPVLCNLCLTRVDIASSVCIDISTVGNIGNSSIIGNLGIAGNVGIAGNAGIADNYSNIGNAFVIIEFMVSLCIHGMLYSS